MRIQKLALYTMLLLSFGAKAIAQDFLTTSNQKFIDHEGNQIILHGINYVNKSAKVDQKQFSNPENFQLMKKWGLNCLRLGVIWAGVEPQPGIYDEEYLKDLDKQVKWANDNGIYVFLDMHQDLYSQLYSDGAPEWATLTDGQPHIAEGPVWSDAYFTSPAVKTAITNFWENKAASDNVGVQDHYIKMWKMLAKRYAGNSSVIGFDLINEPNLGWGNSKGRELMAIAFIEAYAKKSGIVLTGEEVTQKWLDPVGKKEILEFISDRSIYAQLVDRMFPVYQAFEKEQLMPFYKKTVKAIREVNQDHLIFLETSMSSNMGVYTAIERIPNEDGLVYAPHGYDLVVDTPDAATTNNNRINFIFNRHAESAKRLKMPLLIGEWGAFGANGKALSSAFQVTQFFESSLCGETYWSFDKRLDDSELLKAISRAYPKKIAGELTSYSTDVENGKAEFRWLESTKDNSQIYIPKFYNLEESTITLKPYEKGFELVEIDGGWHINIPSALKARKLTINP
ncbi:cellulase family glycosylhydrolase [Flagellimonas pacifica]|uniref:Endoglycosylceramidase n=1 Tax=Flagellimonas pacifica TaxID=1247520 RepID=A0A285MHX1_9FLAO|nr:cellulase family glycosylhydrolase [Allomuricauda parva]SNY95101.1 endoglycosylceramidase [Allomuricauda parva]